MTINVLPPEDTERPDMKITDLTIKEGSFVKRGANQFAFIKLFKSADAAASRLGDAFRRMFAKDGMMEPDMGGDMGEQGDASGEMEVPLTTAQVLDEEAFWSAWATLKDAFLHSCHEIMESAVPNKREMLAQSAQEFVAGVEAITKPSAPVKMEALEAALEGYAVHAESAKAWNLTDLKKTLDQFNAPKAQEPKMSDVKKTDGAMSEEMSKALADMCKACTDEQKKAMIQYVMASMEKPMAVPPPAAEKPAETPAAEVAPVEVPAKKEADLPESIRKELEDARAEKIKLTKALEIERDLRINKELADEVKSYGAPAGVTTDQAVMLLKAADSGAPVDGKHLRALLKAHGEIAKLSAVLTQFGHNGEPPADSASARITKLAKEYADANKVSLPVAKDAIYTKHPELYSAERAEIDAAKRARMV